MDSQLEFQRADASSSKKIQIMTGEHSKGSLSADSRPQATQIRKNYREKRENLPKLASMESKERVTLWPIKTTFPDAVEQQTNRQVQKSKHNTPKRLEISIISA